MMLSLLLCFLSESSLSRGRNKAGPCAGSSVAAAPLWSAALREANETQRGSGCGSGHHGGNRR